MSYHTSPSCTLLTTEPRPVVEDWPERSCEANDRCLQELFRKVRTRVRARLGASPGPRTCVGTYRREPHQCPHAAPHLTTQVLATSAQLPPDERLVMYDACDEGEAARVPLGPLRKRLDSRRNTKPKKAAVQLQAEGPV